jgi:pyruvate-formate lyase-activating enzyme
VNEFFGALKSTWPRLTTLIETNGSAGPQAYLPLLTNLDLAIVDLKASHPQRYTELTGGQLEPTLETIRFLHREKKLYSVQQVIVPGFTDTEEGVAETARLLAEIDPHIRLKLLRFRSHGTFGPASEWPSPAGEVMDRLVQVAIDHGLAQVERSL